MEQGAAPAGLASSAGHSGGVGAPLGWPLRAARQELADDRPLSGESAARRRKENAAVERREARRPASLAGGPWRSRDRPDRKAGQTVRRSAPAPVGAPPPLTGGIEGRRAQRLTK